VGGLERGKVIVEGIFIGELPTEGEIIGGVVSTVKGLAAEGRGVVKTFLANTGKRASYDIVLPNVGNRVSSPYMVFMLCVYIHANITISFLSIPSQVFNGFGQVNNFRRLSRNMDIEMLEDRYPVIWAPLGSKITVYINLK
jgi:hypothetical protein